MKIRTRPLASALASAAGLATLTALLTSAAPAVAATTPHLVDTDTVDVRSSSDPARIGGGSYEQLKDGRVFAGVNAKIYRNSGAGCRSAIATFTFADGTREQTKESSRICSELGVSSGSANLVPLKKKDVVRYTIYLLKSADSTAPATTIAARVHYVGDAPDSLGTAERLDHDMTRVQLTGTTLFQGSTDYRLSAYSVPTVDLTIWSTRSRVRGELRWSDKINGSKAVARVHWTFADGSTTYATSSPVERGVRPTRTIDLTSPDRKDVVSTQVTVISWNGLPTNGATAPLARLGDRNGVE